MATPHNQGVKHGSAEQPSNESQLSYKTLTVNSSWKEILEAINHLQRELAELREVQA